MLISVITVCFNALPALIETHDSLAQQTDIQFEYIVVDGNSTDGTADFLKKSSLVTHWISEPDLGIYNAMNKAIRMANGEALLFLNAGDFVVGNIFKHLKTAPGLIPVKTKTAGLFTHQLKPKNYKQGLPYCHQGILFENLGLFYDESFYVAADYDFYLRHGYKKLPFIVYQDGSYIYYDNTGFSVQNLQRRDVEIGKIIRTRFGNYHFILFLVKSKIKLFLKTLIKFLRF